MKSARIVLGIFASATLAVACSSEREGDERPSWKKAEESRGSDSLEAVRLLLASPAAGPSVWLRTDNKLHEKQIPLLHDVGHIIANQARLDSVTKLLKPIEDGWGHTAAARDLLLAATAPLSTPQSQRKRKLEGILAKQNRLLVKSVLRIARENLATQRKTYAQALEYQYLEGGMDATVTASGPGNTLLTVRWVLANRVLVHELSKGEALAALKGLGFTKFTVTDGYSKSWTWRLDKE